MEVGPNAATKAVWNSMILMQGTESKLTVDGLTLDGGAVWSGDIDPQLGRGTTNNGIKLFKEYSLICAYGGNVHVSNAVIQNAELAYPKNNRLTGAVMLHFSNAVIEKTTIKDVKKDYCSGAGICLTNGSTVRVKASHLYGLDSSIYKGDSYAGSMGGAIGIVDPDELTSTENTIIIEGNTKIHNNRSAHGGAAIG